MIRFKYEFATTGGQQGSFTVDEHSESIANAEAKMTVERMVETSTLLRFDLVGRERAPT